ncbi:molecular chaperone TorD family protein [Cupriavidus sp. D384]|uniref:molecular chaperone TorD family protein n=1 Tax=Cupriavidus sp. D384 TaxID=1538095 RepID=UPI0008351B7D|nr:molecular chaperone TorD family protein [Cupriavidus sp. D384]
MTNAHVLARAQRELCGLAIDRVAGWLAAPPAEHVVAQLQSANGQAMLAALAEEFDCAAQVQALCAALAGASPATVALDIAVSWTRLFEGVTGAPAVSPYESAYANEPATPNARPFGKAVDEMNDLLVRFDMSLVHPGEPSDHVAVELALYAHLLRRGDREGMALMRGHLYAWVPALIVRCRQMDPGGFYGASTSLLGVLLGHTPDPAPQEWSQHAE